MAITSESVTTAPGGMITVHVVSDLVGAPIFFHWYMEGAYLGVSTDPHYTIGLEPGDGGELLAVDTLDPLFDPNASPPAGAPSFVTLYWPRTTDDDIRGYRVWEKSWIPGGGSVEDRIIAEVPHDPAAWDYEFRTPPLADLLDYDFHVSALDHHGNVQNAAAATTPTIDSAGIFVRRPLGVRFSLALDAGTRRMTFTEL